MKFYKVTFDSVSFPFGEKPNYNLSMEANDAEHAQKLAINLIESMGGKHDSIKKIELINALPPSGIHFVG